MPVSRVVTRPSGEISENSAGTPVAPGSSMLNRTTWFGALILSAALGSGCTLGAVDGAVDEDEIEVFDDEGTELVDERSAEAAGRPNNTGGIGAQPLPRNVAEMRGFARYRTTQMSVM